MFNRIGISIGAIAILLYAFVAFTGREFGDSSREFVPADVRHSPGGYRSFHFWHAGYHGGK